MKVNLVGNKLRSFSDGLKRARNERDWTQADLAEKMDVSIETVRNWEQGRNPPNGEKLLKLCDLFDCDLDYLFYRIDCKTHDIKFIHEQTGLSVEAIEKIESFKKEDGCKHWAIYLSQMIESMEFDQMMNEIAVYMTYNKVESRFLSQGKPYVEINEIIDFETAQLWKASNTFGNMLETLGQAQRKKEAEA